jgi:hypothetical protein
VALNLRRYLAGLFRNLAVPEPKHGGWHMGTLVGTKIADEAPRSERLGRFLQLNGSES